MTEGGEGWFGHTHDSRRLVQQRYEQRKDIEVYRKSNGYDLVE